MACVNGADPPGVGAFRQPADPPVGQRNLGRSGAQRQLLLESAVLEDPQKVARAKTAPQRRLQANPLTIPLKGKAVPGEPHDQGRTLSTNSHYFTIRIGSVRSDEMLAWDVRAPRRLESLGVVHRQGNDPGAPVAIRRPRRGMASVPRQGLWELDPVRTSLRQALCRQPSANNALQCSRCPRLRVGLGACRATLVGAWDRRLT